MVKHPRAELGFLAARSGEQCVVEDEHILPILACQRPDGAVDDPLGEQEDEPFPVRLRGAEKAINGILAEVLRKPPGDNLHVHAPIAEDQAQQILENLERGDTLLLLTPAPAQQRCHPVVCEEFLQCYSNFPLVTFPVLCYACHGKDLLWIVGFVTHIIPDSQVLAFLVQYFSCIRALLRLASGAGWVWEV